MKLKIFLLFFFCVSMVKMSAQPELGECNTDTVELANQQIPKALKNWRANNYREAERYLRKALMIDENQPDALYLYGDLMVKKFNLEKAESLWSQLLEVCPGYKAEVKYFLGSILLENGKRKEAIALFDSFLGDPSRDRGYDTEVEKARDEAVLKEQLLGNPIDFKPTAVKGLNTREDEYLATISPDQETMFFTRKSQKVNRKDGPAARVRMVEEFSKSARVNTEKFEQGAPMPEPFNKSYNEGGPSITADNTELYFTVCEDIKGYKNCDIYWSELDGFGYWSTPRSIGDHINRRDTWESQPSVSANGDALYFTSNREGGIGGLDLYEIRRDADGEWSAPRNLGRSINTSNNEKTPFIHSDSQTLYFTSDGWAGLGGYDIFLAKAKNDTLWNKPQNIGYPINTPKDDLGLFVSLDGKTGYFATNKLDVVTGYDIYEFTMPEAARPEEVVLVAGTLKDENDNPVEEAKLELKNLRTNQIEEVKVDKETGNFARVVQSRPEEDLILTVKKKGAAFSSKYISTEKEAPKVVKAPLQAATLEVGKEYTLNDIKFASNSAQLDKTARSVIDEFVEYLNDNQELRADIQGHTDDVGNPADNMNLSKRRAKTVYDYVLQKGISVGRLSHHGYGETKPLKPNSNEENRAVNRRTVFVVTAM